MYRDEAIAIIRKEYLCVDRDCDIERSCGKCDLVMPSKEPILEAFKLAMDALDYDDIKYHEEHGEVVIEDVVWEDALKALQAVKKIRAEAERRITIIEKELMSDRFYEGKHLGLKICLDIIDRHMGKEMTQ